MSDDKRSSFWSSLPGVITALAGMVTALAVLWTTLVNLPSSNSSATPQPTSASSATSAASASAESSAGPSREPTASAPGESPSTATPVEIAFYAVRTDPSSGKGNADLFAIDPTSGRERRLTTDPEPDSDPVWSPDRTRLAFDSKRVTKQRQIWVLETDGSYTQLTDGQASNAYPSWSPDGDRIAWTVGLEGHRQIWVMDARDGAHKKQLTFGGDDLFPSWGSNGLIAFQRGVGKSAEVWVVNPEDGTRSARITLDDGGGRDPAWSPDGKQLAFTRQAGVEIVYVINASGQTGLKQLTPPSKCDCSQPAWSPKGTKIAYVGPRRGDVRPIFVISARGGVPDRVTTNGLTPDWGR